MSPRLWLLAAALLTPPAGANAGAQVFAEYCADCHTLQPGAARRGPPLAGIVGKVAASAPYYRYSDALRTARFVWSRERLAHFLADPRRDLPGNRMRLRQALTRAEVDALLSFLQNTDQSTK